MNSLSATKLMVIEEVEEEEGGRGSGATGIRERDELPVDRDPVQRPARGCPG